jgi:hypothetical protein
MERKQGKYKKKAERKIPRNPSIIDPKYIDTLIIEPGSKNAKGIPSHSCDSVMKPNSRKFA